MDEKTMLPDFPNSKKELYRWMKRRLSALEKEEHPILGEVRTFVQHEGTKIEFERVDMEKKQQESEEQAVEVRFGFDEVPTLVGQNLDNKLRAMAREMGAHKMRLMFKRHNEACEETGQMLNAEGKPLDGKMLLDMIEMAQGGFDEFGKPTNTFVVHPDMIPSLKRANDEVENNPQLKERLASINSKQFQDWIDRENRRKLVD